jgi:hypothetical protein
MTTSSAIQQAKEYFQAGAKILKGITAEADLQSFESIELIMREYVLDIVGPAMGEIFFPRKKSQKLTENKEQ